MLSYNHIRVALCILYSGSGIVLNRVLTQPTREIFCMNYGDQNYYFKLYYIILLLLNV